MIRRALAKIYRGFFRPITPIRRVITYAGISGPDHVRMGDSVLAHLIPSLAHQDDRPNYERGLVDGIRQYVKPGDQVLVVGGGIGITAAHAALAAGQTGHVTCYEGNVAALPAIRRTFRNNNVSDRATLVAAIVGVDIEVYGKGGANILPPTELPPCDVLELDCEGAEKLILTEMTILPRVVLVETHGFLGAPSQEVRALLAAKGYAIEELGVAEPDRRAFCIENDIVVLAGDQAGLSIGRVCPRCRNGAPQAARVSSRVSPSAAGGRYRSR